MKVKVTQETGFKPVNIAITCETQAELDFFGSLAESRMLSTSMEAFGITCGFEHADFSALGADNTRRRIIHRQVLDTLKEWERIGAGGL